LENGGEITREGANFLFLELMDRYRNLVLWMLLPRGNFLLVNGKDGLNIE
jgi:hypothetical protein